MMHRYVACYDNTTDEHVYSVSLRGQSSEWICRLFGLPSGHPAFDCYPINESMVADVIERSERVIEFDFASYSYMIECHSDDS